MSGIGWQDAVAALIVLCALGYLVRRKLRARKSPAPCGNCPACATAPVAHAGETLVNIRRGASAHERLVSHKEPL